MLACIHLLRFPRRLFVWIGASVFAIPLGIVRRAFTDIRGCKEIIFQQNEVIFYSTID